MPDTVNTITKNLSVWLILKSETTSGNIKSYRSKLPVLAQKCKISIAELEILLTWLTKEGLARVEEENLLLHKYELLKKYKAVFKNPDKIKAAKKNH